jgi:peptidoglycan hydrolase-like protein with peptidoglycan-binding domain
MSYDPNQAKDPVRAKSLATAFRDNTANKTLPQIGADPANRAAIVAFQDSAGIAADGKVGPQTMAAYAYWAGLPAPAPSPVPRAAPAPSSPVVPAPRPSPVVKASTMLGVPKSVLLVGTLAALGLAFHKKIGRAIA